MANVFVNPESGNHEVWDKKPDGYLTPEEWAAAHPALEPEPDPLAQHRARLEGIKAELVTLDSKYLTPRVLAGLAAGDEYARSRYEKHETAAAPLRAELADLILGAAYAEN